MPAELTEAEAELSEDLKAAIRAGLPICYWCIAPITNGLVYTVTMTVQEPTGTITEIKATSHKACLPRIMRSRGESLARSVTS